MQEIIWPIVALIPWAIVVWLFFRKNDTSVSTAQMSMMRMTMEEGMRSLEREMMQADQRGDAPASGRAGAFGAKNFDGGRSNAGCDAKNRYQPLKTCG